MTVVEGFHNVPRFSHSNDITLLFTSKGRNDYILGTIFLSSFLTAVFVSWSIILLIFKCKCMNKKNLLEGNKAFLSGHHIVPPMKDKEYHHLRAMHQPETKGHEEDEQEERRPTSYTCLTRVQIVFLMSFFGLVASTILFYIEGTHRLDKTFGVFQKAHGRVNSLVKDALSIFDKVVPLEQSVISVRDRLVNMTTIDYNTTEMMITNPASVIIDQQISDLFQDGVVALNQVIHSFGEEQFAENRKAIDEMHNMIQKLNRLLHDFENYAKISTYLLIPILTLSSILASGTATTLWFKRTKAKRICLYVMCWCVLPLFIIVMIICVVMFAVLGVGAVVNADICSGGVDVSPEGTVKRAMEVRGVQMGTIRLAEYYIITGCESENPFDFLDTLIANVEIAAIEIERIESQYSTNIATICATAICSAIPELIGPTQEILYQFIQIGNGVLSIIDCRNIHNIYLQIAHVGICDEMIGNVSWMFATLVMISLFGFLMLTFRAAIWLELDIDHYFKKSSTGSRKEECNHEATLVEAEEVAYLNAISVNDDPGFRTLTSQDIQASGSTPREMKLIRNNSLSRSNQDNNNICEEEVRLKEMYRSNSNHLFQDNAVLPSETIPPLGEAILEVNSALDGEPNTLQEQAQPNNRNYNYDDSYPAHHDYTAESSSRRRSSLQYYDNKNATAANSHHYYSEVVSNEEEPSGAPGDVSYVGEMERSSLDARQLSAESHDNTSSSRGGQDDEEIDSRLDDSADPYSYSDVEPAWVGNEGSLADQDSTDRLDWDYSTTHGRSNH